MFHRIDSADIAKEVAKDLDDFPEIIIKKIIDCQFREMSRQINNNAVKPIKLDFIGRFDNGVGKFFAEKKEKEFDKKIENIFKNYEFK